METLFNAHKTFILDTYKSFYNLNVMYFKLCFLFLLFVYFLTDQKSHFEFDDSRKITNTGQKSFD